MIAPATTNAAAPSGAAAYPPAEAAGGVDAFAALLDGLAASGDAATPGAGGINIGVESRGRKPQLPVEFPVDVSDASAESCAADRQAADAGLALLLASLTMPPPIRPSGLPTDAPPLPAAATGGDALASAAVETDAPQGNAPAAGITEFALDKAAIPSQSSAGTPAVETQADGSERSAFERELSRTSAPEAGRTTASAVPQTPDDPGVATQLADTGSSATTAEVPRELTAAASGPTPPVQQRFSTEAIDRSATPPTSRDDKLARSPGKAGAADTPAAPNPEAIPADAVAAASASSNLSSGSGRDNSSASSSQSAVEASMAAPARAARSAQAFARAMDVHMAAVAAPGTTSHVQSSMGVVNATAATVPDDLSTQIVQAVRMQWSDGVGDARITLKPEYLGDVTISLHVDQGSVTAVLHADSPAVRSWLQANEPLLGQALSEHGLKLERLVVSEQPPTEDGGAPDDDTPRQQEQPRRRRQRPDAAGFEIIL